MANGLCSNSDVIRDVKNKLNEKQPDAGNKNVYIEYQVKSVLAALGEVLEDHLSKGEKVRVSGVAQFEVVDRPAREIFVPSTGEMKKIGPRRKTKVTPDKTIREF